ncbi:hypothetical protein HOD38_03885 [archaeon]|jgi:hypothetical protein|nr:hypothetical protein [archaeon]MBT4397382.1 hypothetical protein [archaeon]MBT4440762.1 hypothetical protein [archaeon]
MEIEYLWQMMVEPGYRQLAFATGGATLGFIQGGIDKAVGIYQRSNGSTEQNRDPALVLPLVTGGAAAIGGPTIGVSHDTLIVPCPIIEGFADFGSAIIPFYATKTLTNLIMGR